MKKAKLYEEFITENVKEVYADEISPKAAKGLLTLASKQKEDKFQGSYTVDKGNQKLRFDTYAALLSLVKTKDSGPYGPSYGVNITGKKELEAYGDNGESIVGKLNTKSLSAAISSVQAAAKKAEAKHKGK
jgi:hypothetical protein